MLFGYSLSRFKMVQVTVFGLAAVVPYYANEYENQHYRYHGGIRPYALFQRNIMDNLILTLKSVEMLKLHQKEHQDRNQGELASTSILLPRHLVTIHRPQTQPACSIHSRKSLLCIQPEDMSTRRGGPEFGTQIVQLRGPGGSAWPREAQ